MPTEVRTPLYKTLYKHIARGSHCPQKIIIYIDNMDNRIRQRKYFPHHTDEEQVRLSYLYKVTQEVKPDLLNTSAMS